MMTRTIMIALVVLALTACTSEKVEVLKSPCAGIEGSPCGPKHMPSANPQIQTPDHV